MLWLLSWNAIFMLNKIEVLILCGGEGRRLRQVVSDVPKPMALVNGRPFLEYLVENLLRQNLKNICFLTGYKSEAIESYFKSAPSETNFRFSKEDQPLGTGGAIIEAIKNSSFEHFLILNGDTYFNIDIQDFLSDWRPGFIKMALKEIEDSARYGLVEVGQHGQVKAFVEKSKNISTSPQARQAVNAGVYLAEKSIFTLAQVGFVSLEKEILPHLVRQGKVFSQMFENDFIDIGIPEDYFRAQNLVGGWFKVPTIRK
jgi:D-glycero-alpha-D-manno-heptose 1-phosphate guanylyltransferase